ncbi:glycosyl hydrolases family 18 domain-containing protein [Sarocladium implicatum]|nr:glycosyl hydrolases family 18 domain-containing protein [Sarocladium implicatum]
MPPIPPPSPLPRLVVYYQTLHDPAGKPISILPLLTQPGIAVTHVILAALHINEDASKLTLNDHSPSHPRHETAWAELRVLQAAGIKVMGLLGGAAQGSYQRLDGSEAAFERYYGPLKDLIRERGLDGVDLDVEEEMSLEGIIRLIDRLRADFGPDFIISMAPVAMAMLDSTKNMSGFDYEALEVMRGRDIAWYNTQFYCGWGDCSNPLMYDLMIRKGWPPQKLVVGTLTSPANGGGFVPWNPLSAVLTILKGRHGGSFGGVAGWEYFNSLPGGKEKPWEWARQMSGLLRGHILERKAIEEAASSQSREQEVDPDKPSAKSAPVPSMFEYFSDGSDD